MRRAAFVTAVIMLAAAGGCISTNREVMSTTTSMENPWEIGATNVPSSLPWGGGRVEAPDRDAWAYYRVGKTDSLTGIAIRYYGDRRYSEDIFLFNKKALQKSGGLRRGMVLILPAIDGMDKPVSFRTRP